ncbi:MAG: Lpg1974 family pore-forming outer membrane protein [Planctomycetaceae bacterium]|nr:Lpg1974 family pore-forming outer membrane protein [Planctomycetaceae bacterium]
MWSWRQLAALALWLTAVAAPAAAQTAGTADESSVLARLDAMEARLSRELDERIGAVDARIDSLQRLPAVSAEYASYGAVDFQAPVTAGPLALPIQKSVCDFCGCHCCCCPRYGLEAGAEATFLRPTLASRGTDAPPNDPTAVDFDYEAAPRIWLGYTYDDGWGLRARYWQIDAYERFESISLEGVGNDSSFLTGFFNLDAYTVDAELTRQFAWGNWCLLGALGVRHAEYRERLTFSAFNLEGTAPTDDVTLVDAEMLAVVEGTGPTLGLDARRPFGAWNLALIGGVRVSALWGKQKNSLTGNVIEFEDDGAGGLVLVNQQNLVMADSDPSTLWIGEAQGGLEWSQPYECFGGGLVFARAALEWQGWGVSQQRGGGPLVDFFGPTFSAGFVR